MRSKIVYLIVGFEQGDGRHSVKLVATLEEGNFKNEEIANQVASELLHQRASSLCGST